jgi:Spy/CpxP family protein refolding chaperone
LLSEEFISDLTPQQYAEIKELILNKNKILIQTENELNEKKALLKTLETSDNPNMKSIDKLIEEIGSLIVTQMRANAECTQKIRSLLTEEQRVEFDMKILNIQ